MNVRKILFALTKAGSRFAFRQHFCAVPNLSWGLLEWEADLAIVTNSGWLWEIEIKVSENDWLIDRKKAKWALMEKPGALVPRRFYYAAPAELAAKWDQMGIPEWAGVIAIREDRWGRMQNDIIRPATDRTTARKLTDVEILKTARLASMRFWGENHKAVLKENTKQEVPHGE